MHDKMRWTNENVQFVFHTCVREYDMEAASVSVCEHDKLLPIELINEMKIMPKDKRTVKMGKLQRDDKVFSENLLAGIRNIRKKFIETNNLTEDEILSLHSDACIINTRKPIISNIEGVNFRDKNQWNSYIRYKGIEMFYKIDLKSNYIDYKNVPDELVKQQTLGFNIYLKRVFEAIENYDTSVLDYLNKFQKQYLQNQLPEQYYVPFGRNGQYKFTNLELTAFISQIVLKEVRSWR